MGASFIPPGTPGRGLARITGRTVYPRWRGNTLNVYIIVYKLFLSAPTHQHNRSNLN